METLVQRLVQNPHDQETITYAHQAGQSDPKSYAMLLEKVGTATSDPAFACHWLTEAANVWSTTLGDAHRAARALMIAIDRDPTQATPAERLAELYRDKGDNKALVALLERRAKALALLSEQDPELRPQVAVLHEELGQLWQNAPLAQPKKAIESYKRAIEFDATSQYSIYAIRELYKAAGQWSEAAPYFELEQQLVSDNERKIALYQDEGDVRKNALDFQGAAQAFRRARELEGGQDATLKQQFGSVVLERVQAGQTVPEAELSEAAALFVELAEEYPGEHGLSYSLCALELVPAHDRAVQLAMYYAEQLNRSAEVAPRAAAYLKASPEGALASEARKLISDAMAAGGDDSLLDALAPPATAADSDRVLALVEMAQALARKAKRNDAAAKFREVLAIEPGNTEAIGFLEPFLRQTKKYQELRDILKAAGADENSDTELRQGWLREVVGLCETQLRDIEGAIGSLKALLAIDPDDEPARSALKRLLEKQSRWDELAALMADEAEQTLDIEARISLEKALAKLQEQKRKDPFATGEAWTRIASLATGDEEAITTAVGFFEKAERRDRAIQVIAENIDAVSGDLRRGPLLQKLAELREAAGDLLTAGEAYSEAASLLKRAPLWESAERCFIAVEAWDQAATATDERAQLTTVAGDKAALLATEAGYLSRAGDESSSVLRLEQATELDPSNDGYASELEQRYLDAARNEELTGFLLRRADKLDDRARRSELRKRAAKIQRETLGNPDAARQTLQDLLEDGDDLEALNTLAEDAEQRAEFKEAIELLERLERASKEPADRVLVLLRQAAIKSDGLDDFKGAIALYERVLKDFDPKHDEALIKIAELYQRLDEPKGVAVAWERRLQILEDQAEKLKVAERLAELYQGTLEDPLAAVGALDLVRELDPENFDVVARLAELCEKLGDWPRVAKHLAELIEVEGDEEEVSRMTRRLAEILHEKVKKSDEALAVLMLVADAGDEACRQEYVRLGDELGWKGVVASKLVEWYVEASTSPARNASLRGAFERFVEVGRDADAASVAKELARSRGATPEIAEKLEQIAVKLKDLDALGIAHDLMVQELSGPSRAEEMVRQAEVLAEVGVEAGESINHGEQALTSVPPAEVEPLLARLAKLTDAVPRIIEIYERQISRCKAPSDKLAALGRAAVVAASHGVFDKARGFFDVALGGAVQEETLNTLVAVARSSDSELKTDKLRRTLAEALANGGQGSRDGGRTRGMLLGRAAELAHRELKDTEQAFAWLGDAIVSHVDDEPLAALEALADELGQPKRAETVLSRALEEVFDGPLVRKLLARRAAVRREKLSDPQGAAADLKRLHDLSPADGVVMDQLSALYVELDDYKGMVQLYEDQILRGKEPSARAELARKVARLWEERLSDPREAADAWRRVLRMKAGDPEAAEGLDRAKTNMLKRAPSDPPPAPANLAAQAGKAAPPAKPKPAAAKAEVEPESADTEAKTASEPAEPSPEAPSTELSADLAPTAPGEAEVREAPIPEAGVDASPESASLAEPSSVAQPDSVSDPASIPMPPVSEDPEDLAVTVQPPAAAKPSPEPVADESELIPITVETAAESAAEDRPSQPVSPPPSSSPESPFLPTSAMPEAEHAPVTNGSTATVEADDPGRASVAPAHKGPPPKPPGKKGATAPVGSIRPPPPPPRAGVAPAGSGRPPPPPTGANRAAPPPPAGGARPAPPPPPGSRGIGKPPLPPAAALAPDLAAPPPNMSDEDELTVDEDELIDDKL
jgi:Tfp pilus assembly protein PilF